MDKVDGYLTLSSLRNEPATAAIPFILMTGLADNAGMRHGMELGADDYLPKPFTIDALYAAVEARLKKAQAVRDEAEKKAGRFARQHQHDAAARIAHAAQWHSGLRRNSEHGCGDAASRRKSRRWARSFTNPASGWSG